MNDKPLQNEVGSLCNDLAKAGLPTTADLLHKAIGDRSREEHEKWDAQRDQTQDAAIEALAQGIHTAPQQQLELPLDELRKIQNQPPQDLGSTVNARSNELEALTAANAIRTEGKRLFTADPLRLLNGIVALAADKQIWLNFGKQIGKSDLYKSVIEPAQVVLLRVANYDRWLFLLCQAARFYGVRVRAIPVEQVYRTAPEFVKNAGDGGTAMTLSTSSGILDPLERDGTEQVLQDLKIPKDSELAKKFHKKDAWRVVNFRDGLLNPNPEFKACRTYFFDRSVTAKAIRDTLALLPDETKPLYIEMAAKNLAGAFDCPRFELYEVPKFVNWMWRYTRSSPNHALISLRHKETKSIAEGIELHFKDRKKLDRWFQRALGITSILAGAVIQSPLITAVFASAMLLEKDVADNVRDEIFRREVEADVRKNARPIILSHAPEERVRDAADYIRSLIA